MPTFINDLIYQILPPEPRVYWYFGAALEFYAFYAWVVYKRPAYWLLLAVLFSLALQFVFIPSESTPFCKDVTFWIRKNFIGWVCSFALGVFWARGKMVKRRVAIIVTVLSFLLFFPSMFNEYSWHFSSLFAIIITIAIAHISAKIPLWNKAWIWMGTLSGFIFVAHPIVRHVMFIVLKAVNLTLKGHLGLLLIPYVIVSILLAILYRKFFANFIATGRFRPAVKPHKAPKTR
ncbi:MAG: hypothetical protein NC036_07060 [Muribaculaceae bacterium]|nr:hypothetical protein [Muribaculaceae bacterium]